jgi:hypothetical protein
MSTTTPTLLTTTARASSLFDRIVRATTGLRENNNNNDSSSSSLTLAQLVPVYDCLFQLAANSCFETTTGGDPPEVQLDAPIFSRGSGGSGG